MSDKTTVTHSHTEEKPLHETEVTKETSTTVDDDTVTRTETETETFKS